jgi:hypothetical protein
MLCRYRRNYKQLVETTVEIALRVGVSEVVTRVVDDLKDESEPYRRMVRACSWCMLMVHAIPLRNRCFH